MTQFQAPPRALFLAPDGSVYPDSLVCSGKLGLPGSDKDAACPFSDQGLLPKPAYLDASAKNYSIDKGLPGDLCPPCAKQQLGHLGHWQGHGGQTFPEDLLPLRLFKCRMWLWLVVPGLRDDDARQIQSEEAT